MSIVVSDAAAEESLRAFAHPLSIQAKAISDLESRLLDGQVINDGNNVFTFLTEFSANMVADAVNKSCNCFNSLYPENAQTSTDLYKHLSDFDYIGLFATPAHTTVNIVFDRNYLIDNAVEVENKGYSKIIIPEYSKFTIGEYTFGLMYPIEIRVRKIMNAKGTTDYDNSVITVMWDTSIPNPLHTLESHILEHRDFVQENQTLTSIKVPIYQFAVDNHVEDAIASTGFAKRYDYPSKFYAIRVFHFKAGAWHEMAQTLSDINYDVDVPTAMIKVLMDIGKVEVVIPQIYFNTTNSSASIGNRILVKIYTTEGELNIDTTGYGTGEYQASFLLTDTILVEDDTYSNMLKRIPTIYVLANSNRISSGTDGITMEALRERVKHSASYTVKVTPDDLAAYFSNSGFTFTKVLDNITDRVYCAHKVLTDATGTTIAAGTGVTHLTADMLNITEDKVTGRLYVPGYSAISVLDANSVTIQPGAIYKYDADNNYFTMVSDNEWAIFKNQTLSDQISQLNSGLYTYSPFHVRLSLKSSLPIAGSYDLFNPSLKSIIFDWENPNTTAEMSIYTAGIKVLNTGKNGYRLSVAIFKTANIDDVQAVETDGVAIKNIELMLTTVNSKGVYLYMLGTYNGKDANDRDVFIFDIVTRGRITEDNMVDVVSMYDNTGSNVNNFINLDTTNYTLSFFLKEDKVPVESQIEGRALMEGVSMVGIPGALDGYVKLCSQSFKLTLGNALPLLENNVSISASEEQYLTYPTTQFATYNAPIYERWTVEDYKKGVINPITGQAVAIEAIGTLKLSKDASGKYSASVKHAAGDVIISSPYGMTYGPTFKFTDNDLNNTALITLNQPFSVTSDMKNTWSSVDANIMVTGTSCGRLVGLYSQEDTTKTGAERVWVKQCYATEELFDIAPMNSSASTKVTLYQFTDASGSIRYSMEEPETYDTYDKYDYSGTYYSSNSDYIKELVALHRCQDKVNTSAKGTSRRWFREDFDFNKFQGFVIEYNVIGTSATGIERDWVLDYVYPYTTNDGLQAIDVIFISKADGIDLSTDDQLRLQNDSYLAIYSETTQVIRYNPETFSWELGERVGNAITAHYTAKTIKAIGVLDPWEYTNWKYVQTVASGEPSVYCTSNATNKYSLETKDALAYIIDYILLDGDRQMGTSDNLYKYIDEGFLTTDEMYLSGKAYYERIFDPDNPIHPYSYVPKEFDVDTPVDPDTYEIGEPKLVDRLSGHVFVWVDEADVSRTQEYCNSLINYVGDTGAVGTADARGAIYYKDPVAMSFKPADYNITLALLANIVELWVENSDATEDIRYEKIQEELGITPSIAKLIVSDTEPCYFSPWRKLVTATTITAVRDYYNHGRIIVNCHASEIDAYKAKIKAGVQVVESIAASMDLTGLEVDDLLYISDIVVNGDSDAELQWCGINLGDSSSDRATALFVANSLLGTTDAPVGGFVQVVNRGSDADPILGIDPVRCGYDEQSCADSINNINTSSGYIGILREYIPSADPSDTGLTVNEYINYLSLVKRTYVLEDESTVTRKEFNINFDTTMWSEVDAWPWEYKNPWIREHYEYEGSDILVSDAIADTVMKFDTNITAAKLSHLNTDVLHDNAGNPIVDSERSRDLIYDVNMIHCDYKLTCSDDTDYLNYVSDIRALLRSYFDELNSISPTLLARTKLYFAPIRTFGNAQFKGHGGTEITLPLEFSIGLGLHVESYVDGSDLNKETIKNSILTLIDKRLKEGYLNLALLARDIMDGLSDNIICVDVLGIDGDSSLQTMLPVSEDCYPQLKQVLVLNDDGSVHTTRRLDLTWSVIN